MRSPIVSTVFVASVLVAACTGVPQPAAHGEPDASDADADGDGDVDTGQEPTMTSIPDWRLTWAVRAGGDEHDEPSSGTIYREGGDAVVPLDDGSVYVAGQAAETAVFGEGTPNETKFPDEYFGHSDAFLAKYDPDGALDWVRRLGGEDSDHAFDVTVLVDGSAVVVGRFDSAEFVVSKGETDEAILTSGTPVNAYAARYTIDGDLLWARQIPKSDTVDTAIYAWSVDALADGTILVAGNFKGIVWPGEEAEMSALPSDSIGDNWDGFLAWFDAETGVAVRTMRIGGDFQFLRNSIGIAEDGSIVVASFYSGSEAFGVSEPNGKTLVCDTNSEYTSCNAIAKYSAMGQFAWAYDIGAREAGFPIITMMENNTFGLYTHFSHPSDMDGDGDFSDSDGFAVAAYRVDDGSLEWLRKGTCENVATAMVSSFPMPGDGMIVGLVFSDTLVFDGDIGEQVSMTYAGEADIALARFSSFGEIEWIHRLGGGGNEVAAGGAQFDGTAMWLTGVYGSDPFIATSGNGDDVALPLEAQTDIFLMRFDSTAVPTD